MGALARRLGVTPSHLSRVIKGERRSPRLEKALRRSGVKCAPALKEAAR